jgi:hypothetical protein
MYMLGFAEELDGRYDKTNYNGFMQIAYDMGRGDALAGDDIPSLDYQTDEEILARIKK